MLVSCLVNAPCALMHWYAVSSKGRGGVGFLFLSLYIMLPFILVILSMPIIPILLIFRRLRRVSLFLFSSCLIYLASTLLTVYISETVRMSAFHRLATRSAPLVAAIKQFENDNNAPPQTLADLVPRYLPEIPKTGMSAYPNYNYVPRGTKSHIFGEAWPEGNSWILYVYTPSGGINFDTFLYFPAQNYPKRAYSSWLERVEDWAYAHE